MAALDAINQELGSDPDGLIRWALTQGQRPIVTTNFRPFEAVILHMVTQQRPDIPVVWMDHGYNTEATYRFADALVKRLDLNLISYIPQRTRAHREAVDGAMPGIDDPRHEAFTREVKLEPFERALREMAPDVWFTALRAEDTPGVPACSLSAATPMGCSRSPLCCTGAPRSSISICSSTTCPTSSITSTLPRWKRSGSAVCICSTDFQPNSLKRRAAQCAARLFFGLLKRRRA